MKLVGMFDSPYVRRVAISMRLLDLTFEHLSWSIGKDQDRIKELNPAGEVPVLVLDNGEVITESLAITDYLDDLVGPERALTPRSGEARRQVMRAAVLGIGMANKARLQMYELLFRPKELRHPPLRARLNGQMLAIAEKLDELCATTSTPYLFGDRISQADISLGCAFTYATETVGLEPPLPALRARAARLAELPVFREIYLPFDAPVV